MFSIIIKEIKEFYRSPVNLFMAILFPVLLIFFLGTMLQNLDVSDWEIGEINVQYSTAEANEFLGKKRYSANINNCLLGYADSAYGYKWQREEG